MADTVRQMEVSEEDHVRRRMELMDEKDKFEEEIMTLTHEYAVIASQLRGHGVFFSFFLFTSGSSVFTPHSSLCVDIGKEAQATSSTRKGRL